MDAKAVLDYYATHATELAEIYASVAPERVHAGWKPWWPSHGRRILDVGAGIGRDAAWLAGLGNHVTAVEPCGPLIAEGKQRYPEAGIRWIADALPDLGTISPEEDEFDCILVSGVWMHLDVSARERSFQRLCELLAPEGMFVIGYKTGGARPGQPVLSVPDDEVPALARRHGLETCLQTEQTDTLGRTNFGWKLFVLRGQGLTNSESGPHRGDL